MDEIEDEDPAAAELGRLQEFARGRAGAELGTKLGLPDPNAAAPAEGEAPIEGAPAGEGDIIAALQAAGIPPEQLQAVLEALKASGG